MSESYFRNDSTFSTSVSASLYEHSWGSVYIHINLKTCRWYLREKYNLGQEIFKLFEKLIFINLKL